MRPERIGMFGIFKTKNIEVVSPVTGKIVSLERVDDEVFSKKLVGDGIAVIPEEGDFGAPFDGEVSKIFSTKHAYSVRHKSGAEVIVHIGLETVALNGEGFTALAAEGDRVKAGDTIIKADLEVIAAKAKDIVTPVVVTESGNSKSIEKKSGDISKGEVLMELK